ncbi:MAG: hypothetical protein ACXWG1_08040 [Usitatibacter sp.]
MRRSAEICVSILLFAASGVASAAWTLAYEGPDELLLVGRPNSAGTNTRGADLHPRQLPAGRVAEILSPSVTTALQGCAMDDVRRVAIAASPVPDRIGETMTRLHGLGIYMSLPLADRVSMGNFYLAPFFALTVTLVGDAGPLQSYDLYEFNKAILDRPQITEESFLDARTADVEASVVSFVKARMPGALRKALGSRCPAS